jgi:L-ascorbate metabolism protein UlaG (beta-lactamase superfamily)
MKYNFPIYISFFFLIVLNGSINTLKSQTILNKDTAYHLSTAVNDSISLHYIGCSGFFIKKGKEVVLIDPYFSNRPSSTFLFGRLINKSNITPEIKNLIDNTFLHVIGDSIDGSGVVKTLVISHGHVDHFGDVPYLFDSGHLNKDTVKIIGSTVTQYYLGGNNIPDKNVVKQVEAIAATQSTEGKWVYINSKIRILPIISEHGPHVRLFGLNFNLVPKKHEQKNTHYKYWRQYATGQILCYLIDFLNDDGSINFRIYHNSASSNYPFGFPPQSVLNQHPVDVAILCVASFHTVKNYPEDIVKYLKPKHIILSHWEDFFGYSIPELKKKPKEVPLTNVNKFLKRLDKVMLEIHSGISYTRPNVNTSIKFFYWNKHNN